MVLCLDGMNSQKPLVLVVEDDPIQNRLICLMAEEVGCASLTALSGRDGVRMAKEKSPDLILMDIHLPDISGFQGLKEMRAVLPADKCRVLLMSVDDSEEAIILGISSGADGFIQKPFKVKELAIKIKRLLNLPYSLDKLDDIQKSLTSNEAGFDQHFSKDTISLMFNSEQSKTRKSIYTFSSILIIHLKGLNDHIDKVDSEKLHELVNDLIGELSIVVYRNRGSIHHFIGETLFATFGTPVVYDNDTINALLCANDIMELGKGSPNKNFKEVSLQTAIISGKVYSGILNTEVQKINHAVLGEPIRQARRLDTRLANLNGDIVIDKNTLDVIGEYTRNEPMEPIEGLHLYRVTSLDHQKIATIPNLNKQYTPKDSVSDEGYEKL